MIVELFDSYGYDSKGGNFICNAVRKGLKYEPETRVPRKRNALCTFLMESGQETNDINQSPLLYKNKIECDEPIPKHDYSKDYFTTEALEDGTISFNIWKDMGTDYITSISYSKDNGETWTTVNNENNKEANLQIEVDVEEGDKILWKGGAQQLGYFDDSEGDNIGSFFSSTCEFNAYGNVMSMLYGDNFSGRKTLSYDCIFARLFNDYNDEQTCFIVNASNISLPATTLANSCYSYMFYRCTSLTSAPELPATTLAVGCYSSMFNGCISLTTAPELSATILAGVCYGSMFYGCTSLNAAPELPATTLANYCYDHMFYGCTSLTAAPELPAATLAQGCYNSMFYGCTELNYIKALFTTTPTNSYTLNWVKDVAANGTFVKSADATWSVVGDNGVPTGWSVENA